MGGDGNDRGCCTWVFGVVLGVVWRRGWVEGRQGAEGEEEAVNALIEFCKRGPPMARVTSVDLTWENYSGEFDGFKIKCGQ